MTVGQMIDRIVAFKLGNGDGRYLRYCDPQCADALNEYWAKFGPHGLRPCRVSCEYLFNEVEARVAAATGAE